MSANTMARLAYVAFLNAYTKRDAVDVIRLDCLSQTKKTAVWDLAGLMCSAGIEYANQLLQLLSP